MYTKDKPAMKGLLSVPFESLYNSTTYAGHTLDFIPDGKTQKENIEIGDVIGYSIDSNYYALKRLIFVSDNAAHLLFVKRLTKEDSRIQLYELYESGRRNATAETEYLYFISLPGASPYETINTRSSALVPNFDLKMSALVSDCPALKEKIRDRVDGYFIPLMTRRESWYRDVMLNIINEYNACR